MIGVPTTFVIGAGASVPYGLPAAIGLHSNARRLTPDSDAFQLLRQSGVNAEELKHVLDDLRKHPAPSIDEFLESRQHQPNTIRIGKAIIAVLVGQAIAGASERRAEPKEDWLWLLIDRMRRGASTWEEFAKGNSGVRFVTFNFDTVVEDRLRRDMRAIYPEAGPAEANIALAQFPVVHVHGCLPSVPDQPLGRDTFGNFSMQWVRWANDAPATINVVLDSIPGETLERARDAVQQSVVLCFLGFSYAGENLKRLNLPNMFAGGRTWPSTFGSARGIRAGDRELVRSRLPTIVMADMEKGCLDVLLDFFVLRE